MSTSERESSDEDPPGNKPRVIVICGPTATGKTATGIALAQALTAEIISADSMQVYRRMDIGTAKPTAAERAAVAHHLIDVVDPDEPFDAARYAALARARVRPPSRKDQVSVRPALQLRWVSSTAGPASTTRPPASSEGT